MVNILITSAGRRGYLVEWFRDASIETGIPATIIAGDANSKAPALKLADAALQLPPIQDPDYVSSVLKACREHRVGLMFALHDYDIAVLSEQALDALDAAGITAMIPPISTIDTVTDKLAMSQTLSHAGIPTPHTTTGSDAYTWDSVDQVVVKHRYGSGSSGVLLVPQRYMAEAVTISSISAPDQNGTVPSIPNPDSVIVQRKIEGQEYGLDIVCDQRGEFQGVLARRKLGMRAGETDRAVTVDATSFRDLARHVASTIALRGSTDMDVIVATDGSMFVIDINPRFGGGYPFCHVAGANVPACYLAWASGEQARPEWMQPELGIESSKQISVHIS